MNLIEIQKTEWKRGLWIAHLKVRGEYEQAVSRQGFNQLMELVERMTIAAYQGRNAA